MSTDRREQICARLLAIADTIAGVKRTARMQEDVTAASGPWIVLWDGDESRATENRRDQNPTIEMNPAIRIVVEAAAKDVGTTLNGIRLAAIKAIVDDATLKAIVGTNGRVSYDGCTTGIEKGAKVEGELWLNFAFQYPLLHAEL
jgi:hypothetical protein